MANIIDYIQWRGDVPFTLDPFNEIDSLVLSTVTYVPFTDLVPGTNSNEKISLRDLKAKLLEVYPPEFFKKLNSFDPKVLSLLIEMAKSERFGDILLSRFVSELDEDVVSQFAAVTYDLPDGSAYVCYRGTDHSIAGWKEDFNLSYLPSIPGQQKALAYLNGLPQIDRRIMVGGHSKGGNLSVYAASFASPQLKANITDVFTHDGPGFREEVTTSPQYQNILPLIRSTIPEHSFIGMLLTNPCKHHYVKTSVTTAEAHDPFNWLLIRNRFDLADDLAASSELVDATFREWINNMNDEERAYFVETIFAPFVESGINDFDKVFKKPNQTLPTLLNFIFEMPADQKKFMYASFQKLYREGRIILSDSLQEKYQQVLDKLKNTVAKKP